MQIPNISRHLHATLLKEGDELVLKKLEVLKREGELENITNDYHLDAITSRMQVFVKRVSEQKRVVDQNGRHWRLSTFQGYALKLGDRVEVWDDEYIPIKAEYYGYMFGFGHAAKGLDADCVTWWNYAKPESKEPTIKERFEQWEKDQYDVEIKSRGLPSDMVSKGILYLRALMVQRFANKEHTTYCENLFGQEVIEDRKVFITTYNTFVEDYESILTFRNIAAANAFLEIFGMDNYKKLFL